MVLGLSASTQSHSQTQTRRDTWKHSLVSANCPALLATVHCHHTTMECLLISTVTQVTILPSHSGMATALDARPAQAVGPVGPWSYHFLASNILHEATHARAFVGSFPGFINSKACMGMRLTRLHLHLVPRWGKTAWLAATPASLDSSRER